MGGRAGQQGGLQRGRDPSQETGSEGGSGSECTEFQGEWGFREDWAGLRGKGFLGRTQAQWGGSCGEGETG